MLGRVILISYWLIGFVHLIGAQDLSTVNYSNNSPLQTHTIYNIHFASNNLLYIGTDNGFWSYDGINFKKYTTELPENTPINVTNIQENEGHIIYVQNFRGQVFYLKDDKLVLDTIGQKISGKIETYTLKGEFIYYTSHNKVHVYNTKSKKLKLLNEPDSAFSYWGGLTKGGVIVNSNKDLFDSKFRFYKLRGDTLIYVEKPTDKLYDGSIQMELNKKTVFCIKKDDSYLIKDENDSLLVDLSQCKTKLIPYRIENVSGELLIGCREGLYISKRNQVYLKGMYITAIVGDNEGNIWCATLEGGLFKVNLKAYVYPIKTSITTVSYAFANKNELLIADQAGNAYHWSEEVNEFQCFHKNDKKSRVKEILFNPYDGFYWVSSSYGDYLFDQNFQRVNFFLGYGIIGVQGKRLHKVRDRHSLFYCNINFASEEWGEKEELKKTEKLTVYKISAHKKIMYLDSKLTINDLNKWRTKVLAVINDTLNYIDTEDGLYRMQPILKIPKFEKIYVRNDRLFVLTSTEFIELDIEGSVIGRIKRKNGLEDQRIINLSVDNNHIAISTKQGVYLLDASTFEELHQFTTQNGIASNDFSKAWLYNGDLYVNGSGGVSCIKLDGNYNKGNPFLSIDKVWVNDSIQTNHFFAYDENSIALHLDIRSYTVGGTIKWRLNKKAWKTLFGEAIISLDELQYGHYVIDVYFENDLGASSETINYHFEIDKPYWLKGWFWMLLGVGLSGILFLTYKRRISWIEEQNRLKNNLIASQMTALKSQMNPHFIFNALNSIQSLVKFKKNKEAYKYINKFAILLRETLNYSDRDFIPLERELSMLQNYLDMETMRFDGALDFKINVNCSTDIQIPSMIIQPFVENAIKHGLLHKRTGQKQLTLDFELKEDELLICTVTDNGVGRKRAQEIKQRQQAAASFSTSATKKRLELLQELYQNDLGVSYVDLYDTTNNPIGTKVIIAIPIDE